MASRHRPSRELNGAVVGLAGLAWLTWVLLGLAGYRHHGAPALKDTVGVLQLVFATVAGAGAPVALIVAYRRQKVAEANSVHDRTRVFNERFTTIATQLGDAQPAVRLAGVHAMAGLADDLEAEPADLRRRSLRLPAPALRSGPGRRRRPGPTDRLPGEPGSAPHYLRLITAPTSKRKRRNPGRA